MMSFDFVIIGAGIIGLTLANELINKFPGAKIAILEKEAALGLHASGRNSGVLHSGIYYPADSLKAKLCKQGFKILKNYCFEYDLPLDQCGKVLVSVNSYDDESLDLIYNRAVSNDIDIQKIDAKQLRELEPLAQTCTNSALWVPGTSVFDPKSILKHLEKGLVKKGVKIFYQTKISLVEVGLSKIGFIADKDKQDISYGHLFNTAGLFADDIARRFGFENYSIMPFKGIYYYLNDNKKDKLQRLIYPAIDLKMPFLGIHVTKSIDGSISLGPSALPALGRENYKGLNGLSLQDCMTIGPLLLRQYWQNRNNFRRFVHSELANYANKKIFISNVRKLMPSIMMSDISARTKVGIRAQLINLKQQELVMDLLIKNRGNSTHVLNAVSPAFTCSFAMAEYIVQNMVTKQEKINEFAE